MVLISGLSHKQDQHLHVKNYNTNPMDHLGLLYKRFPTREQRLGGKCHGISGVFLCYQDACPSGFLCSSSIDFLPFTQFTFRLLFPWIFWQYICQIFPLFHFQGGSNSKAYRFTLNFPHCFTSLQRSLPTHIKVFPPTLHLLLSSPLVYNFHFPLIFNFLIPHHHHMRLGTWNYL